MAVIQACVNGFSYANVLHYTLGLIVTGSYCEIQAMLIVVSRTATSMV
jgi:hypothetical protein